MNTHALTSIVFALGITNSMAAMAADEGTPRTRVEVTAERDAAQASGWITAMTGEDSGSFYLSQQPWVSSRTRADVIAELNAARESGLLAELQREGSEEPMTTRPTRIGAPVRYVGPNVEPDASQRAALAPEHNAQ